MSAAKVYGLLLAAGSSSRMLGEDKLLKEIDGVSLLRHSTIAMLNSNISSVMVVVKAGSNAHIDAVSGLDVSVVEVKDATSSMSASIRAGIESLPADAKAVVIGLADMPDLEPKHYNYLCVAYDPSSDNLIVLPTTPSGRRGHPVLFDARFFDDLKTIAGDQGARELFSKVPKCIKEVRMSDEAVTVDLDTQEAWKQWIQRQTNLPKIIR